MINKQSGRTIPLDSTEFNDAIQGQNEDGFYISILREFKYWMRKDYVVLEVDAFLSLYVPPKDLILNV